jgi:hypothetical protein
MKTITTSRILYLGASAATMMLGLAGTASAWFFKFPFFPVRTVSAPEIDPATAASGLALLAGGVMLLLERRRARRR